MGSKPGLMKISKADPARLNSMSAVGPNCVKIICVKLPGTAAIRAVINKYINHSENHAEIYRTTYFVAGYS
jgi:hypothetical protein